MFTPPDAFYAARKVATVKRACEGAGFPLSRDDCRKLVARAWGYACWADVGAAMARGDATGPFDEDLAGHDYVMSDDEEGALRVARRRGAVGTAFCALTRLPVAMGDSFSSRIRLSDDPARSASFGIVDGLVGGAWLSPAEFEAKRRRLSEPLPPNLAEFARSLEATMRSEAPGSPPPGRHPPR